MRLPEVIEAILFVSDSPMTVAELLAAASHNAQHNGVSIDHEGPLDAPAIETALSELMIKYAGPGYAFELKGIAGGYQFLTKESYAAFVKASALVREHRKLSRAALETLAIVAYRQPVTRSEIEFIRGVNCEYALHRLLEKQLIEPAGRAEMPGRPLLYRTTKAFMDYFGLASLTDLPKLTELKADEEALAEAFRTRIESTSEAGGIETDEAREEAQGQQASLLEDPSFEGGFDTGSDDGSATPPVEFADAAVEPVRFEA